MCGNVYLRRRRRYHLGKRKQWTSNGEKYIKSLSVGQYGPKRCVDRILDMLESYGVKATFFVPGLTAERYPEVIRRIAEAGHEIGHHGYAHERFAGKQQKNRLRLLRKHRGFLKISLAMK